MEIYKKPPDFKEVANKYWDLSKLVIVLVGNSGVTKEIEEIKKLKNKVGLHYDII